MIISWRLALTEIDALPKVTGVTIKVLCKTPVFFTVWIGGGAPQFSQLFGEKNIKKQIQLNCLIK